MDLETVDLHIKDHTAIVRMNRPEKRNAFNSLMVEDLTAAFRALLDHPCRSIVLTGEGSAFSAGADLDYMSAMKEFSEEENYQDAMNLAELMDLIYTHPKPVIAQVNGPTVGGGVGLVAACDIAIAKQGVIFMFSEVRLGLTPAVISPYCIRKLGESRTRELMLTGDRFNADKALHYGLVHRVCVPGDFDNTVRSFATAFAQCGPVALDKCKQLIRKVGEEPLDSVRDYTARLIAELRISEEGQEGMGSFLEKRDPYWQN